MPQNPLVPRPGGSASALHVTVPTVIKATPGTVFTVTVLAAATGGTFGIFDCKTTGAAAAANAIVSYAASWPAIGAVLPLSFPCGVGIVVNPGTGGAVSVAYA